MTATARVRLLVCGAADRGDDGVGLVAAATLLPTLDERQLRSLLRLLERVERGAAGDRPVASIGEGE